MDILIIGSGGREHSLVWKLRQSLKVKNIFVAPGNAGTSQIAQNIDISKTEEIIEWVRQNPIDLVIVGPDNYLADGIIDRFEQLDIKVFGPTKAAAEIEWSKAFAKQFMKEEGIPTANYEIFDDIKKAKAYAKIQTFPLVIKASGLALGKGVTIVNSPKEAEDVLQKVMNDKIFGDAGNKVVIEEYLEGREISVHVFCDGENFILFPPAQDHKRIFHNNQGPNTGGMGTIVPVPWVTESQMKEIGEKIVRPTLGALKKLGRSFKGILFPGVMITKEGPKVIEFNARFGDPEAQSYMRLLETDLADIIFACINGTLKSCHIKWSSKFACCVVCASGGYPGEYKRGKVIEGLNNIQDEETVIFHAGTKLNRDEIVTNGGRVLGVTSVGEGLPEALVKSYSAVGLISFDGMQYRKDIGAKSLN